MIYKAILDGNEYTDTFPWAVVNTALDMTVDRYTHHAVAESVAYALNNGTMCAGLYLDEIDEHIAAVRERMAP